MGRQSAENRSSHRRIFDSTAKARQAPSAVESERIAALRLAELPRLEKRAGAALTFWQHAAEAIKVHGADGVNWADVERKTIVESISEHGQPPLEVADVICQHSPGAVTKARQDDVRALVDAGLPLNSRHNTPRREARKAASDEVPRR